MTACRFLWLVLLAVLSTGCETLSYYAQSASGHLQLMERGRPIESLLSDDGTDPELAERLRLVQQLREFAVDQLDLPDNGSYRSYADIERGAVVWSVVATPAYSVEPQRWCYPLVGCLAYRGYFDRAAADGEAEKLRARGMDVAVLAVPAYSTLGWFPDPLPSTVIHWPEPDLAGLMFHELAHQRVYIPDDTAFNEAYASAVARLGVGLWLADQPERFDDWRLRERRTQQVADLLLGARDALARAFAESVDDGQRARRKQAVYAQLTVDYLALSADWPAPRPYGHWFAAGRLNNAHLAQVATYDRWVPAFERLWQQQHGDPAAFHRAVADLGALDRQDRERRLMALLSAGRAAP